MSDELSSGLEPTAHASSVVLLDALMRLNKYIAEIGEAGVWLGMTLNARLADSNRPWTSDDKQLLSRVIEKLNGEDVAQALDEVKDNLDAVLKGEWQ